jgi:hypothetical protein
MNNSDCNGCKSKDMHIPVEGNFDNTAENVVKVTCRRMQKDQWTETKWTPSQAPSGYGHEWKNRKHYYVSLTHSDDEEDFSQGTAVEKKIKWSAREEPKDFQDLECNLLITRTKPRS